MKKIMVVEDTKSVREELVTILEFEDFEVIEAENGMMGLEYAQKFLPDLIVCDVLMPELDGFGLLKLLREEPATENTPFIFLTAKAAKEDLRGGMELGADDYLTKPFTPEELLSAIRTRLNKHENMEKQSQNKIDALCENIVYAMPHEFITPLTAILGYSELLIDTANDQNIVKISEGINSAGKRLERLIQNFLVYSQVEVLLNSPEKIDSTRSLSITNPASIIKELAMFKAKHFKREKDLAVEVMDANVQISTENLKKIIEELTDNAFKFSKAGSIVNVKSIMSKDLYTIEVSDSGRGMTSEQISNIGSYIQFERKFYEQQGMGLGLTISKKLVQLHNGSISIESTPEKGTKVVIKFKAKPAEKSSKKKSVNDFITSDLIG
ncbi:MAG: response regulator [Candidatus Sericytochromatia bacterium]